MVNTVQKLAKLSLVYVIGDLVVKGSVFLLLPLYAHNLTPEDYGILAVATMVISVMTIIVSFGLTGAILRFYNQIEDPLERRRFYGVLWLFLILIGGTIILTLTLSGEAFFQVLFKQVPFDPYIRMALWVVFFNAAFATIPPALFRARDQAKRFVAFNLFSFSVTVALTIWLVVIQKEGAYGSISARLGAAVLVAIVSSIILLKEVKLNLHIPFLKMALMYSLPFVPHLLSQWILSFSDRAILERYVSLGELGIYSLGYQIGSAFLLIIAALNYPFLSLYSRAAINVNEYNQIPRLVTYYVMSAIFIGLSFLLLTNDVVILILPSKYYLSGVIASSLIWGFLMMSIYHPTTGTMVMTVGRTRSVPFITAFVAVINIALNLWLIPIYGVKAAVFSTILGYVILSLLMFVVSQHTRKIHYEYWRILKILIVFLVGVTMGHILMRFSPMVNIVIGLFILSLFPVGLITIDFLSVHEREQLAHLAHKLVLRSGKIRF